MILKNYGGIEVTFLFNSPSLLKIHNVIYLLKFPNNKVYIGQTTDELVNRVKHHCHEYNNNYKCHTIHKYNKFKVTILKHCNIEMLDTYEIKFISLYKENCINYESGGHVNKKLSDETKLKISNTLKAKHYTTGKKVKQYDLQGNFIQEFKSTKLAGKAINKNYKTIWNSCTKHIAVEEYIFIYEDEILDLSLYTKKNTNLKKVTGVKI